MPSNERETPGRDDPSGIYATPASSLDPQLLASPKTRNGRHRYLGKTGFASQHTGEPRDPSQPDNLWHAVPGDHGSHGGFAGRSRSSSVQTWLTLHRSGVGIGAGLALFAAGLAMKMR